MRILLCAQMHVKKYLVESLPKIGMSSTMNPGNSMNMKKIMPSITWNLQLFSIALRMWRLMNRNFELMTKHSDLKSGVILRTPPLNLYV
jgi:hypothetical protein